MIARARFLRSFQNLLVLLRYYTSVQFDRFRLTDTKVLNDLSRTVRFLQSRRGRNRSLHQKKS